MGMDLGLAGALGNLLKRTRTAYDDVVRLAQQGQALAQLTIDTVGISRLGDQAFSAGAQILGRVSALDNHNVNPRVNNLGTGPLSSPTTGSLTNLTGADRNLLNHAARAGSSDRVQGGTGQLPTDKQTNKAATSQRLYELNTEIDYTPTTTTDTSRVTAADNNLFGRGPSPAITASLAATVSARRLADLNTTLSPTPTPPTGWAGYAQLPGGEFDGIANPGPSWANPAALTSAVLMEGIHNWQGSDNDPLLDGLIREFENRAEPEGGWSGLGQHRIVTSDFTVRANGLEEQLPDNDRIGQTLADDLQAAGFEENVAHDLAAHLRVQYAGDEVALHAGLEAALGQLEDYDSFLPTGSTSVQQFADKLDTGGNGLVLDLNHQFFDASTASIQTAADQAGRTYDDGATAQIIAYSVRNGITVSAAARQYFGIDVDRPPPGVSRKDMIDPEVVEIGVRITQQDATNHALTELANFDYENAVTDAIGTRNLLGYPVRPEDDFDGDGLSDFFRNPDGQIIRRETTAAPSDIDQIFALVETVSSLAPTQEDIDAQAGYIEFLKDAQLGVANSAYEIEHLPLSDEQIAVLETLIEFDDELYALRAPTFDGDPYLQIEPRLYDDPDDNWVFNPAVDTSFGAVPVAAIEELLALYERAPDQEYISPQLLGALRQLIDDPQLLAAIADRGSSDLFETAEDFTLVDFDRVSTAATRDTLLAILEPYADDIDISRKGEIDGTRVDGDLRAFIEQASEDPTVPRRVIEAAQLALDEGFTDASLLAALHLGLDLVGATEIPVISQIADGVNAGLYVAIDRDYLNAGISLIGVAATGTVALRNSARIGELADDAFDRARIITSLDPERGAIGPFATNPTVRTSWPDNFSIASDWPQHAQYVDVDANGAFRVTGNGLSGGHNAREFATALLNPRSFADPIPGREVSRTPILDAQGRQIGEHIRYQIPQLNGHSTVRRPVFDADGNPVYKAKVYDKTVYDPGVLDDATVVRELSDAAASAAPTQTDFGTSTNRLTKSEITSSGLHFTAYYELVDGSVTLRNAHFVPGP